MLFDQSKPQEVRILSGGEKVALLRFPTDQELCDRQKRIKSTRKQLGRNKTEFEPPVTEMVDSELFEKLRLEPENERASVDPAEAAKFLSKLLKAQVTEVERNGDQFEVKLRINQAITVLHVLKMPTQKDVLEYGRHAVRLIDMRRTQEFRSSLEPGGALWDKLIVRTEGYANGHVPITHKDAAIVDIVTTIDADDDDDSEL